MLFGQISSAKPLPSVAIKINRWKKTIKLSRCQNGSKFKNEQKSLIKMPLKLKDDWSFLSAIRSRHRKALATTSSVKKNIIYGNKKVILSKNIYDTLRDNAVVKWSSKHEMIHETSKDK